jgi:acetyltransferase-like isoleucine patch superfamily enzyme
VKRLIHSFLFLIEKRPQQIGARLLEYLKFKWTHLLCRFLLKQDSGIELAENVRLQRFSSLMAERPSARVQIGRHSVIYEDAAIEAYGEGQIELGESCVIGDTRVYSRKQIKLGARVITSWNVFIQDYDPHPTSVNLRAAQIELLTLRFQPSFVPLMQRRATELTEVIANWRPDARAISIGDDVWIGANSTILKGVEIGAGCIVAAGSVVTAGVYPERSLLAGNPAQVIRSLLP